MNRENKFPLKVNLLVFSILSTLNMATVVHADPKANIGSAEIMNIANAINGSSYNKLSSFNVEKSGLILNNSADGTESKLLGNITGNSNLAGGAAEDIIIEVNSKKGSVLNGPVEVAGTNARVILSNPSGITCSSCNFLSTNSVVLSTGALDVVNNKINSYKVQKGNITFNGNTEVDNTSSNVDLIARNILFDGVLIAPGMAIKMITGTNDVNANDDSIIETKGKGGGSKYSLKIEKDAELKAGHVKFIGTESKASIINNGALKASDKGIEITHSGELNNTKGKILSLGDIHIKFEKGVTNRTGNIQGAKSITVDTAGDYLNNIQGGNISAIGAVSINSGAMKNEAGFIGSEDKVDIQTNGKSLINKSTVGEGVGISAIKGITINSGSFINKEGQIRSENDIDINTNSKDFNNSDSTIDAMGNIVIHSGTAYNSQSRIRSVKAMTFDTNGKSLTNSGVTADTVSDDSLGILSGENGLIMVIAGLNNNQGVIASKGNIDFTNHGNITNKWGTVKAGGFLKLFSEKITNQYGGLASKMGADVTVEKTLDNSYGVVFLSGEDATIKTPYMNNNFGVIKGDSIHVTTDKFNNTSGFFVAEVKLAVDTPDLSNNNSAAFKKDMGFYLGQPDQKGGIVSKGSMVLNGGKLSTSSGRIVTEAGNLAINFKSVDNSKGLIASKKEVNITTTSFVNSQGTLFGEEKLTVRTAKLKNAGSGTVDDNNLKGVIASDGIADLGVYTDFENGGMISSKDQLTINVEGKYTNSAKGIASGANLLNVTASGNIINRGILNSMKDTELNGKDISNEKSGIIVGREGVKINNTGSYSNQGKLVGPTED